MLSRTIIPIAVLPPRLPPGERAGLPAPPPDAFALAARRELQRRQLAIAMYQAVAELG
ncbi:MAG TPA: hypothetical protein VMV31_11605 [Terriglobales bacterium]|nr:hypothetical protein [Terriglobales bacterium]